MHCNQEFHHRLQVNICNILSHELNLSILIHKINSQLDILFNFNDERVMSLLFLGLSIGLGVSGGTSLFLLALGGPLHNA